jgi:aquaporin Z
MGETETAPESQINPSTTEVKENVMKKYLAELLGTFVLVFMGVGSAVFASSYIGLMGVSFAFGLSLLVMVYAIGGISGCHINPAVSISMLVAGKMKAKDAVMYIIFQCVGGVLGAAAVYSIALGNPSYSLAVNGLGANGYADGSPLGYSLASCFAAEVLLTFLFLLVIHGSLSERVPKGFAGLPIGLSLVLIHLVSIPITNTSVNPARSLGPAVFVGGDALVQLWLFWVAPIVGAVLAALLWKILDS